MLSFNFSDFFRFVVIIENCSFIDLNDKIVKLCVSVVSSVSRVFIVTIIVITFIHNNKPFKDFCSCVLSITIKQFIWFWCRKLMHIAGWWPCVLCEIQSIFFFSRLTVPSCHGIIREHFFFSEYIVIECLWRVYHEILYILFYFFFLVFYLYSIGLTTLTTSYRTG